MVAGDWQPHIPAATIGRPRIADGVVHRPGLLQPMLAARAGELVVIAAPTGYGKTTTAALWDDADERPFAWVRVDHLDDDPVHLLLHIATAVERLGAVDRGLLGYLRGPGRGPLTHLVPAVVQALEACGPLVIVLDDDPRTVRARGGRHAARPHRRRARVDDGGADRPTSRRHWIWRVAGCRSASSRSAPMSCGCPTRRRRRRSSAVSGSRDDGTVSTVLGICEGWAAGVILAGMALRDGAAVEAVTGHHDSVADYLVEEVLDRLDDDTVTFLVESSVLDRFNAEQLDEVLERDDSAQMLARLSTTGNLFLVSLDQQRVWYRYHRLFADVLRGRLRSAAAGRLQDLARRAADMLERRGDIDGALLQALAADDRAHAAALVGREAVRFGFDGRAGVLARRLGWLDKQTFAEYPDAAIARAWLGVTQGDADLIQRSLMLAHHVDHGQPLADGTPSVKVAAALISSLVGVGGVHEVVRHADVVRAAGDSLVNPWWGAATVMKGAAESMLGNAAGARAAARVRVAGDRRPARLPGGRTRSPGVARPRGRRRRRSRRRAARPPARWPTNTICATWSRWWSCTRPAP